MKPTAPSRNKFSVLATTPWRGLSPSRFRCMAAYQVKGSLLAAIVSSMMMIAACSGVSFGAQPPLLTVAQAAMFTPKPKYPEAARRKRLMGKGIFLLNVNTKTGRVTSIKIERKTGYDLLDVAALEALIKWRFKP